MEILAMAVLGLCCGVPIFMIGAILAKKGEKDYNKRTMMKRNKKFGRR